MIGSYQKMSFKDISMRLFFNKASLKSRFSCNEKGVTLIELVVIIIILSIIVPVLLKMIGQMGIHHVQNEAIYRSVSFANTKMEEIVAYKHLNTNWAANINNFAGSESLSDGYSRTVAVTTINSWISAGTVSKNAYQVTVSVTPPLGSPYTLTVVFAQD
jgi:hypothetical protein